MTCGFGEDRSLKARIAWWERKRDRDYNFCPWSLGDFFVIGIVFYSWMPHDDKTAYKMTQLFGDYKIRHGPCPPGAQSRTEEQSFNIK